jgi:D-glycerate 3-kinase
MGERSFTKDEQKRIVSPLAERLKKDYVKGKTTIVGMQGGQGTGKTTIVDFLKKSLRKEGFKVQSFSIDDFYETDLNRRKLSKKYPLNPFYQVSRGMPGTHRIKYLEQSLKKIKLGKPFEIPIFDKSLHQGRGDVLKRTITVKSRQDFVIIEGWCVGIPSISSVGLIATCKKNKIDLKRIDPKLKFHKLVLQYVKQYQNSWDFLGYMIMIKPDSSSVHKEWRLLQENRMKKKKGSGMSTKQVSNFVEPYLPFTYLCYDKIKTDAVIKVSRKHEYYKVKFS